MPIEHNYSQKLVLGDILILYRYGFVFSGIKNINNFSKKILIQYLS